MAKGDYKYRVEMTERLQVRMTSEQKELVFRGGSSAVWREVMVDISELKLKLERGEITPEQFREQVGNFVFEYLEPEIEIEADDVSGE